jgi:hypothetical protein
MIDDMPALTEAFQQIPGRLNIVFDQQDVHEIHDSPIAQGSHYHLVMFGKAGSKPAWR